MTNSIQAIRGFNDILPADSKTLRQIESQLIAIANQYHYQEIRIPIVEKYDLFSRSIGDFTDIVNKEMYCFNDRNNQMLALRPEGTAGCVRAALQHKILDNNSLCRLWYLGPMFRYERPQKGRARQFNQFSIEAFAMPSGSIDVELIHIAKRIFERLSLPLTLEINWLGEKSCRLRFQEKLVAYFKSHESALTADEVERLHHNPIRLLDSKNPIVQELCREAPQLVDSLSSQQREQFDHYRQLLDDCSIKYTINPNLVRGLDYYNGAVFEWTTQALGSQSAVCAGGRYDGLIHDLGGKPNHAAGFSIGIERLYELYQCHHERSDNQPDVYIIGLGQSSQATCLSLSEKLHDECQNIRSFFACEQTSSLKAQLKKADKLGAQWVFIIGEYETNQATYQLKNMRHPERSHQGSLTECLTRIKENHAEESS
tara:strand:- start:1656 stop:2939 length:1284 start_codon:yes stop_codon:yes gene_type:complete